MDDLVDEYPGVVGGQMGWEGRVWGAHGCVHLRTTVRDWGSAARHCVFAEASPINLLVGSPPGPIPTIPQHTPAQAFYKLDTTCEPVESVVAELGVKALPAFRFFKNGKEVEAPVTGYKKRVLRDAVAKINSLERLKEI